MRIASTASTVMGSILLLSMSTAPSFPIDTTSTQSPASMSVSTEGVGQQQSATDPYLEIDLIDHIEWRQSVFGRTMRVYPTSWLRVNGGSYDVGEAAWNEIYDKYRTAVTKNLNGLRDQLICHVERGAIKDTYNLDEWLADVGYDATVAADCQPGKDS